MYYVRFDIQQYINRFDTVFILLIWTMSMYVPHPLCIASWIYLLG